MVNDKWNLGIYFIQQLLQTKYYQYTIVLLTELSLAGGTGRSQLVVVQVNTVKVLSVMGYIHFVLHVKM